MKFKVTYLRIYIYTALVSAILILGAILIKLSNK